MKKYLVQFMSLAMASLLIASCSLGTPSTTETSQGTETQSSDSAGSSGKIEVPSGPSNGTMTPEAQEVDPLLGKTPLPISDGSVTLKILNVKGDEDPESSKILFYQDVEKATGVKIEWIDYSESQWAESKGLVMSSKELPDAFMGQRVFSDLDLLKYSKEGAIRPVEDLIEQNAPNFMSALEKDPSLRKQLTSEDGHIFGLPTYDAGFVPESKDVMYINQEWLKAVGKEVPTNYDELYDVLKAFKEQDPNGNGKPDEIPLSFPSSTAANPWFASFGAFDNHNPDSITTHIEVRDGKVVNTATTEEYKTAIQYFNKLFSEGLIDKEAFTQEPAAFNAKLKSVPERLVGLFYGWRSTSWVVGDQKDDYIAIPPFKGPSGLTAWTSNFSETGLWSRGSFVVSADSQNPELTLQWGDNLLSPANSIQSNLMYRIGFHIEREQNDKFNIVNVPNLQENEQKIMNPGNGEVWIMLPEYRDFFNAAPPHMVEKFELDKIYQPYFPNESQIYPKVFFSLEESEKLNNLRNDINKYINDRYANWMMKGGVDAEWDQYLATLDQMGLKTMMEIYQNGYDRYNGN